MSPTENRSSALRRALIVVGIVVITAVAWSGIKVWSAWRNVERIEFDTESAREALGAVTSSTEAPTTTIPTTAVENPSTTTTSTSTTLPTLLLDRSNLTTFLVIGSDDSTRRADVILLLMLPPNSGDAIMVSIPRDLYVPNPCTGTSTKINANLFGCAAAGVSGPEQLAIAVEDFTGVPIDHFAMFTFPGFRRIIDRVGGVEICVGPYPIRDLNEDFDNFELPAGCSLVNGEQALSWVRSRRTQQLTDAGWVTMPGVNDLTRNQRQQELLLIALDRLKQIRSLPELQGLVQDVADAFIIDENLSLGDAIALLWDARTISSDDIYRVSLDVRFSTIKVGEDENGDDVVSAILLLDVPFSDAIVAAYPRAYEFFPGFEG